MSRPTSSALVLAFAAIYVIWGTTFLGITLMLRTVPPFLGGALRFLLAGAILYLWLRRREAHPFGGLHPWGTILCGVLLSGIGNGFIIWSQTALPSGIAALFVASLPVSILLQNWAFFARRAPRPLAVLGVATGLAGIIVLSLRSGSLAASVRPLHVLAVLAAEVAWGLATLLQPRFAPRARALQFTCLQMLAGGVCQLLMAVMGREWRGFAPQHVSMVSVLALLYLVVFGSIIGYSCYAFLVAHVAPQKAATYALVNPVIALVLGAAVLHERITPAAVVSTILVLTGVALVLLARERPLVSAAPALAVSGRGS